MMKRFGLVALIGAAVLLGSLLGAITALADGPPPVVLDAEILVFSEEAAGTTPFGIVAPEVFAAVEKVAPVSAVLEVAVVSEASRTTGTSPNARSHILTAQ